MINRNYNCKDEELPVICNFGVFSFERDLADFTAYSSKFNPAYATQFKAKIADASELIEPKSETIEKRIITERIYQTMDNLIDPINRLKGYVDMSGITLNVSFADFGLTALRDGIRGRDAESVIKNLHTVITNIEKFKVSLTAEGLSEPLIARFVAARVSVAADKQKQYEILINRKNIVQNNVGSLNELYDQLCEIFKIGKILYKQTDPVKLKEYTFTVLMKQVRRTVKNGEEDTLGNGPDVKTAEAN